MIDEPAGGRGCEPRKPQLCHRLGPRRRGAEVRLPVGPLRPPTRPQEDDDVDELPAVGPLPGHEIVKADLVGRVGGTLGGHVDDDGRTDEPGHVDLVGGPRPLGEVPGRVEVRAAVLGRHDPVGGVVVALGIASGELPLQHESLLGRPIDRVGAKGMRQIDPPARAEPAGEIGGRARVRSRPAGRAR